MVIGPSVRIPFVDGLKSLWKRFAARLLFQLVAESIPQSHSGLAGFSFGL